MSLNPKEEAKFKEAFMATAHTIVVNLRGKNYQAASEAFTTLMQEKVNKVLTEERTRLLEWDEYDGGEHDFDDEPQEDDITTDDHETFYSSGKKIADSPAEAKAWMKKHGYFPNVWFISDHGNAHLTDILSEAKMTWWKVMLNGKEIDKIQYTADMDADEVKRSLVNHDGYDSGIKVIKEAATGYTKKALIRAAQVDGYSIQPGKPAPMHLNCVCGNKVDMGMSNSPTDGECTKCGQKYDTSGYLKEDKK
jgi:hypothetical protein